MLWMLLSPEALAIWEILVRFAPSAYILNSYVFILWLPVFYHPVTAEFKGVTNQKVAASFSTAWADLFERQEYPLL